MKTFFRIILYLLLLALIPVVIYLVQPTALFASLPFSQQKISQRRQSDVYQQATEQTNASETKQTELPTYNYGFPNPQVMEDLVLIDLMKVWENEVRVGQQGAGAKVTAMQAPTKWLFPGQEGTIFSPIHERFVWRAVAIMRGDKEQIEKENLGVDPENPLGTGGEAVKIRQAMERVISSRTVEDVIPAVGKQKLKEELRQELNRILNNKVEAVYLDLLLFQ